MILSVNDFALSVVIPTYHRHDVLHKCLRALLAQTISHRSYEIIVVDDHSTDSTESVVRSLIDGAPASIRYFRQGSNKGPAAARNVGIRNARGRLVLLIGDDIIASPTLLEEHLKWHADFPEASVAVLGHTTWSPEIKPTPFMRWLESGGPQFGYYRIENKENVPWTYLYTSNISFKTHFLLENGLFNEDFRYAAYEDSELGFRLSKHSFRIVYNDRALGHHYHPTSLESTLRRMENVGESWLVYLTKTGGDLASAYPESPYGKWRERASTVKFAVLRSLASIFEEKAIVPAIYSYVVDKSRTDGFRKAAAMAQGQINSSQQVRPNELKRVDAAFHDATARSYDKDITSSYHIYHRYSLYPWIKRLKARGDRQVVLDLGTGTGVAALALAMEGLHVVALDHSPGMLEIARQKILENTGGNNTSFALGDCEHLPFPDDTFDALTCQGLLHHLQDMCPTLLEIARTLRTGGVAYISEPCAGPTLFAKRINGLIFRLSRIVQPAASRTPDPLSPPADSANMFPRTEAPIQVQKLLAPLADVGLEVSRLYFANYIEQAPFLPNRVRLFLSLLTSVSFGKAKGGIVFVECRKPGKPHFYKQGQ